MKYVKFNFGGKVMYGKTDDIIVTDTYDVQYYRVDVGQRLPMVCAINAVTKVSEEEYLTSLIMDS